jgi:hypothetical protein
LLMGAAAEHILDACSHKQLRIGYAA